MIERPNSSRREQRLLPYQRRIACLKCRVRLRIACLIPYQRRIACLKFRVRRRGHITCTSKVALAHCLGFDSMENYLYANPVQNACKAFSVSRGEGGEVIRETCMPTQSNSRGKDASESAPAEDPRLMEMPPSRPPAQTPANLRLQTLNPQP